MLERTVTEQPDEPRARRDVTVVFVLAFLSFVLLVLFVAWPTTRTFDASRYLGVEPKHGTVEETIVDDERTGFIVRFLDARAEGEGAEQYLAADARSAYESYGDERDGMESRALYALWRYRIQERVELDDGSTRFWVMEEGHERANNKLAGYIDEQFIVRPGGSGFEIDVTEFLGVTAY